MFTTDTAAKKELERIRVKFNLPALAVELITGNADYCYVSGVRKCGDSTPARITDKFHLGSCTKAMTATVLAVFIEKGLTKWDSTLEEIFPEYLSDIHPAIKDVQIQMLSAHRSGVVGDITTVNGGNLWKKLWSKSLDPVEGRKIATHELLSNPPANLPGSKYEYSNGNYIIIGAIIEKLSGKSWETIISEELFNPLQMNSCGFGAQADPGIDLPDQPWPHQYSSSGPVPVTPDLFSDNPPTLGPAGTIHCAIKDWAKFAKLHLNGFNGASTEILKPDSFKKLHKSYPEQEYTFGGWERSDKVWAGGTRLLHTGTNTMNFATICIAPQKNTILLIVTNTGGAAAANATGEVISAMFKNTI